MYAHDLVSGMVSAATAHNLLLTFHIFCRAQEPGQAHGYYRHYLRLLPMSFSILFYTSRADGF